jgi:hypothetical protein
VDDDRLTLPVRRHVLVLDPLLEQHDPSSSAFGRGGRPGTYASTGMIWSTPLVKE